MGNAGSSGRIGRADRQGHVISESPVGVSSKLHLKSTGERLTIDYVSTLPPEVGSHIVQYLFPEDIAILRLVCRRWRDFVDSEIVQQQLCAGVWPGMRRKGTLVATWRELYKIIQLGASVANRRGAHEGHAHFSAYQILDTSLKSELDMLLQCRLLRRATIGDRLAEQPKLMEGFMARLSMKGSFLPEAMRALFTRVKFPGHSSMSSAPVLRAFVTRYVEENPCSEEQRHNIHILCYSIILLSVDMYNPHVRCKMSRREFIRNNAFMNYSDDYLIRIYNYIYIYGHICEPSRSLAVPLRSVLDRCAQV